MVPVCYRYALRVKELLGHSFYKQSRADSQCIRSLHARGLRVEDYCTDYCMQANVPQGAMF
jgi:hypothetical protein